MTVGLIHGWRHVHPPKGLAWVISESALSVNHARLVFLSGRFPTSTNSLISGKMVFLGCGYATCLCGSVPNVFSPTGDNSMKVIRFFTRICNEIKGFFKELASSPTVAGTSPSSGEVAARVLSALLFFGSFVAVLVWGIVAGQWVACLSAMAVLSFPIVLVVVVSALLGWPDVY